MDWDLISSVLNIYLLLLPKFKQLFSEFIDPIMKHSKECPNFNFEEFQSYRVRWQYILSVVSILFYKYCLVDLSME
jgi:hypothetical protein